MKTVSKILNDLVASHGENIIEQPQRLKAMLADLLPNEKRMRYLLELSLRAEIPAKLKDIQLDEVEVRETKTNTLKHYFKEEYFLEDNAVKSVFDCWTEVLVKNDSDCETVTDIDGNMYKTVKIGNQIWMAENLRVSRYRNGDLIPNVKNNGDWEKLETGGWCNNDNNPAYDAEYGKLYNWFAVDDVRGLAPEGWHVPSDVELTILVNYLGGETVAGGKLKEKGTIHWNSPNVGATNETYFNALPGGNRFKDGEYYEVGEDGSWWTCTNDDTYNAWYFILTNEYCDEDRNSSSKQQGLSVRCIKNIENDTVTDIDGNVYKTVQIGNQIWMAENLRVSRYRNGDFIPYIENNEERRSIIATGACCNYNYNLDYDFEYGKLYNWYAVDDKRGLAPKGWHVPSAKEWLILIDFLGGKYIAGGKLKEAGTKHWETPNKGATNESGFTALPAGNSTGSGYFGSIGSLGEWWGATIWSGGGNQLKLWTIGADLHLEGCSPSWSLSVRCLKDY